MEAEKIVHDVAERVRAILAEAEERAAQIVREAEADAKRIRERAEREGAERLQEVRQALDELQGKLGSAPATSSNGASAEVEPGPVVVPEPEPPAQPDPGPTPVPEPTPDPAPEPSPPSIPEPTPPPDEGTPPAAGGRSDDSAAARLVAMNLALDGASKEAIVAELEREYALEDPGAVADDVLALAQK
jgi:outer membrane biosynthesis protein TonB